MKYLLLTLTALISLTATTAFAQGSGTCGAYASADHDETYDLDYSYTNTIIVYIDAANPTFPSTTGNDAYRYHIRCTFRLYNPNDVQVATKHVECDVTGQYPSGTLHELLDNYGEEEAVGDLDFVANVEGQWYITVDIKINRYHYPNYVPDKSQNGFTLSTILDVEDDLLAYFDVEDPNGGE